MENLSKKKLHPLSTYKALGFDIDHSLIRYILKDFMPLCYRTLARSLCELRGYPNEFMTITKKEWSLMHNGLIIDLKTGMILKLAEDLIIVRAFYGHEKVDHDQLEKTYGNPPRFSKFDPLKLRTSEYICCLTYFECIMPPIYSRAVAYRKQTKEKLTESDHIAVFQDIIAAMVANYHHYGKDKDGQEKCHKIATYGYYFKDLIDNIHAAVYKQEKMLEALKILKEKGKILFLVSNAHVESAELVLDHALGVDWRNLFDFVILKAGKPNFFHHENVTFKEVDHQSQNLMGKQVEEIEKGKIYLEGCVDFLEQSIDRATGNKDGRIVYFGDQFVTDVVAAETRGRWDGVCVVEELDGQFTLGDDFDKELWGDFFSDEYKNEKVSGFWWSFINKNVAKITSLVDSDEMIKFFKEEDLQLN